MAFRDIPLNPNNKIIQSNLDKKINVCYLSAIPNTYWYGDGIVN